MYMLKLMSLILTMSLLICGCGGSLKTARPKYLSAKKCLRINNKEECFIGLFDINGPVMRATLNNDNNKLNELLELRTDQEIKAICKELWKPYQNQNAKMEAFKIAAYNNAPCVCKYTREKLQINDDHKKEYEYYYKRFKCAESE